MSRSIRFAAALVSLAGLAVVTPAQSPLNPNERTAPPRVNPQDKEDIWVLEFKYKDPRIIAMDVPGRGRTNVWYMWYEVVNRTGAPRYFHPTFDLVTLDRNTTHTDEVLPSVQDAIRKQEDPNNYLDIKNSVTVGKEPIPPSRPDAAPRPVYGLAIWPDVARKAGDTTRFSVFVSGLSNGWTVDDAGMVRRKTLQLNFRRQTDAAHQESGDIVFVPPIEWIYRSTSVKAPTKPKSAEKSTDKAAEKADGR
jgi:hypothetical protein